MVRLAIKVNANRKFESALLSEALEIDGFSKYVVQMEGTQLSSRDDNLKKLVLETGIDGTLSITLRTVQEKKERDIREDLLDLLPKGYEFYDRTEALKVIKGTRGKYYHYKHKERGDFVSFAITSSGKPYKIVLGSLNEPASSIRTVLENLPNGKFSKADLNALLPAKIVENRQPIKAALDILVKESYVRIVGTKGVSEEYVKSGKAFPSLKQPSKLHLGGNPRLEGLSV